VARICDSGADFFCLPGIVKEPLPESLAASPAGHRSWRCMLLNLFSSFSGHWLRVSCDPPYCGHRLANHLLLHSSFVVDTDKCNLRHDLLCVDRTTVHVSRLAPAPFGDPHHASPHQCDLRARRSPSRMRLAIVGQKRLEGSGRRHTITSQSPSAQHRVMCVV
jgi:hypothetical protein